MSTPNTPPDRPPLSISVVIPTRDRPAKLARCLDALAHQESAPEFEVLLVLDGPCDASRRAAGRYTAELDLRVIEAPRAGIAEAKNYALRAATRDLDLLINDDVLPEPRFLTEHATAHAEQPTPAMILGHSPWRERPNESLFDLLLRTTSMVFFYDRMIDEHGRATRPRDHDWGYRHAWNLNLSLPRALAMAVGGFRPAIANCCFEDLEFAWRVQTERAASVRFRPEARAVHDHTYTPGAYLEREWRLGYSAWGFAHAAPRCAEQVFRRDLRAPESIEEARAALDADRDAAASRGGFEALAHVPAASIDPEKRGEIVAALHAMHLPVKRRAFREGLLEAARGRRFSGLFHPDDGLEASPMRPPAHAF